VILLAATLLAMQAAPSLPSSPDPMPPRRAPEAAAPERPAPAPQSNDPATARYRACTDQVRTNPAAAAAFANDWREQGGGLLARQCLGLALIALDRWEPAAAAFEQAAREAETANDPRRADFWAQAGNAWVAAGDGRKALAALDAALLSLSLTDELRGEVHLDRARARVALADDQGARTEIDRALQLVPNDPFGWYLSAALARRVNDLPRAATDIARARQLGPDSPDILLLAGTIAGLGGNMEEAERLYRQVAASAPDSDAGRQAIESLGTMREIEAPAAAPPPAPQPRPQLR
jgi:tetratricopeptide (TPR) repeat protein